VTGALACHHPDDVAVVGLDVDDERRRIFEDSWQHGGVHFAKTFGDQMVDEQVDEQVHALARAFAEQQVDCVATLRADARDQGFDEIGARMDAAEAWTRHVHAAAGTLMVQADSWYRGTNIAGKPRGFMPYVGGLGTYSQPATGYAATVVQDWC